MFSAAKPSALVTSEPSEPETMVMAPSREPLCRAKSPPDTSMVPLTVAPSMATVGSG